MPLIQSAIKRARQNAVRQRRLLPYKTHMKTALRRVLDFVKQGKKDEARKALPLVYKAIDTAAKKQIIRANSAARKKARMARLVI